MNEESVNLGSSLEVQWLGLSAFTTMALSSIPGQETKIWQVAQCSRKKKKIGPSVFPLFFLSIKDRPIIYPSVLSTHQSTRALRFFHL